MHAVEIKYQNGRHVDYARNSSGKIRSFATKESAEYFADTINSMIGPDLVKKFPRYVYVDLRNN